MRLKARMVAASFFFVLSIEPARTWMFILLSRRAYFLMLEINCCNGTRIFRKRHDDHIKSYLGKEKIGCSVQNHLLYYIVFWLTQASCKPYVLPVVIHGVVWLPRQASVRLLSSFRGLWNCRAFNRISEKNKNLFFLWATRLDNILKWTCNILKWTCNILKLNMHQIHIFVFEWNGTRKIAFRHASAEPHVY